MEHVLRQILDDLQNDKLSHAVLIEGGTAAEREETARQTAQAILCGGQTKPCGVCASCVKAAANSHPDILVFSGGTTPGSFKVDTVREIRAQASILPNESEYKVFLLLACETMLPAAQNALLKIIEEPPYFVRFVLCCSTQRAMLDTILSRVTVYSGPSASSADADDEKAAQANALARTILRTIASQDEARLLRETAILEKDKDLFRLTCTALASLTADVLVSSVRPELSDAFKEEIVSRVSAKHLLYYLDIANKTVQSMQWNCNANLLLNIFCAQLCTDPNERI
ncbi:MAG: ATP-binding protein [Clostridia bacterium]|nr:ATP-binding protein [Clostridia bacterium]